MTAKLSALLVKTGCCCKQYAELAQYVRLERWFSGMQEVKSKFRKVPFSLRSASLLD